MGTACILKETRKKSDLQREIELFRARYRESVHVYITCGFSDIQQRQKGAGLSLRTNSCIDKIARFFFLHFLFFFRFSFTMYREINPLRMSAVLIPGRVARMQCGTAGNEFHFRKELHGSGRT